MFSYYWQFSDLNIAELNITPLLWLVVIWCGARPPGWARWSWVRVGQAPD